MRKERIGLPVALCVFILITPAASAQTEPPAAPSEYLESIETPGQGPGVIEEADAIGAEAQALDQNESAPGVSRRQARQVEEIVVQARKRDELLEATPVSVTALSENTLREAGVNRIDDIQQLVPNLSFRPTNSGRDAVVIIRGVGTPRVLNQFDPGVGIYVDGVFLPRAQGALLDVVDIEQIEVLRGPQGTLFGKNTVGGAVNISTTKPREDLEAFAFIRAGNIDAPRSDGINLVDTRVMLNVPVVEDFLLSRVAFASTDAAGFMYNTFRDQAWSDRNSITFLGSLRLLPHDDVTIDITGTWDRSQDHGPGSRCVYIQPTGIQALAPQIVPYCQQRPAGPTNPDYSYLAADDQLFEAETAQLQKITSYGTWGVGTWDVGPMGVLDELSFKAIGSWRQQRVKAQLDTDGTPAPAVFQSNLGDQPVPGGDPSLIMEGARGKAEQLQAELQVNGAALDGALNFVGGYFVFWETSFARGATTALGNTLNTRFTNPQSTDNWNWAIYSQATYDPLDWLSLTAGLRYTEEKKGVTSQRFDCVGAPTEDCRSFTQVFDESDSAIFSAWTPMASVATTIPDDLLGDAPIDHLMTYFTYSRGFRGGGFNLIPIRDEQTGEFAITPFQPETLDSFELGAKTLAFDRALSLNLSLFYAIYDNIQVTSVRSIGDPDGDGVPDVAQETLNAAKATTKGAEIEALLTLAEGLRIQGSVGLIDTEYDEFIGPSDLEENAFVNRAGQSFNRTPDLQTHLAIQKSWGFDVPSADWMSGYVTPRVDWVYQSKIHMAGPEFYPGIQPGYNLVNLRLSYDFNDDRTQVALWSRNVANERYQTNTVPLATSFGIALEQYGLPRTYGVEVSHRF